MAPVGDIKLTSVIQKYTLISWLLANLGFKCYESGSVQKISWLDSQNKLPMFTSFGNLSIFRQFESLIDKVDSEQKDSYLLGDLNCNMHNGSNHNSSTLTNILDIYGWVNWSLNRLELHPPRVRWLTSVYLSSSNEKISKAGVVHLGISDYSLVFMTLKISYERTGSHRTIDTRAFKNFNHHHFLDDVADSHGIILYLRQIRKQCGMFGQIYLWK